MISTGAGAVTASFTLYSGVSSSGFAEYGYCTGSFCQYCEDPDCMFTTGDSFGNLSNPYLPDNNFIPGFYELLNTNSPPTYTIYIYINASTNPGANYFHHVTINCDNGPLTFTPTFAGYWPLGVNSYAMYYFSHSTPCLSANNTYSISTN